LPVAQQIALAKRRHSGPISGACSWLKFVKRQREAREYDEFLLHKVEAGRASMRAGLGRSNDEVEAEFAARRASVTKQA
jgi:hypothetical protein